MLRILFVDDEPQLLESLQDTFRSRRREWDVTFAPGARAALAALAAGPVDVIVTDVRMPEVDGATFLETVRARAPQVIRIALTGYTDAHLAERLARVAHQYLAKPCPPETLTETLERAARIRQLLPDDRVRGVVGSLEGLPPRPRVYGELLAALSAHDSSAADIARILEREPALSAKILQLVNSSFFRLARRITRVEEAVVHLGLAQVRSLALSAEIFRCGAGLSPASGISLDEIQQHSLLAARIASRLGTDRERASEAFLSGIVHEVGLLVLALAMPGRLAEAVARARRERMALPVALRTMLGADDAQVGAYLLGLWGLPLSLLEAVLHHRAPGAVAGERGLHLPGMLHVADALAARAAAAVARLQVEPALDTAYLARAGVTQKVKDWEALARAEATDAGLLGS